MASGERIIITGAAGMIGSVVARRIAAHGHELVLMDRKRSDRQLPDAKFVECDLRDRDRVRQEAAGASVIVHIGEIPNINIGPTPEVVFASNTAACRSMLDAAVAVGARRLIYTSSCQQYGYWGDENFDRTRTPARWPIDEFLPSAPHNAYAHSKAANELACRETSRRTGLETFLFRLPWVVPHGAEAKLQKRWSQYEGGTVDGFWTYVAIDDVAEAYALAVQQDRPLEPLPSTSEAFHFVADDVLGSMPVREKLTRFLPDFAPLPVDWPERRPPVTCAKAERYLGWRPQRRFGDEMPQA